MIALTIEDILRTYDIPEISGEKILIIASRNIARLGLHSFDEQYRHVAELVERFQVKYRKSHTLRLDHSPRHGLDRTLQEALVYCGETTEEDKNIFDESLRETVSMVYIPPRGIYAIPTDKRRGLLFDGDPLAYFIANKEKFRGISRIRLAFENPQLYGSLYRLGFLDLAIPQVIDTSIPVEEKARIIEAYALYGGNCRLAAKMLNRPRSRIKILWKKQGLKLVGRTRVTADEIKRVNDELKNTNYNVSAAARNLRFTYGHTRYISNKYVGPALQEAKIAA